MGKVTAGADGPFAGDPGDHPALSSLVELSRDAVKPPSEAQLERGLIEVRERLAEVRSRGRVWRRAAVAGAAAAVLLATGIWGVSVFRSGAILGPLAVDRPVTVDRIEGGELLDGGYLSESGHGGVGVFFNEGSSFLLAPGTRGRLREVSKDGARFALEDGGASFQITPNGARRWSVEAGPFLVTVKGTVFNAAWDPVSERFELSLRRGRVVVSGPVAGGAIPLRAGQHLVIVLPRAEMVITEERSQEPPEEQAREGPPTEMPAAAAAPSAKHPAARTNMAGGAAPLVSSTSAGRRWAELMAAGHWDQILADVDRQGIDAALESASSEDLLALADAARYRRRAGLARAALLAQRRRYPGSVRALDALFLLGRVEELSSDGAARAIAFYDDYLERAPRGGYAAEALGRKMILTNDLGGPGKARPLADEYLRRFPSGSYAGSARALGRVP